jgi:hypothetical protein
MKDICNFMLLLYLTALLKIFCVHFLQKILRDLKTSLNSDFFDTFLDNLTRNYLVAFQTLKPKHL